MNVTTLEMRLKLRDVEVGRAAQRVAA